MHAFSPSHAVADATAMMRLAGKLAAMARPGDIYALYGDLGAGKTVFARAFVRALCGTKTEVPSPTYTLVQTYAAASLHIIHADLYRIDDPEDVPETGLPDMLEQDDTLALIEWPQNMGRLLPAARLDIVIEMASGPGAGTGRLVRLCGHGGRWRSRIGEAA